MNKKLLLILSLVLSLFLSACTSSVEAENANREVSLTSPNKNTISRNLEFTGNLQGNKETYISTKIPGQIRSIGANIGDEVVSGQVLVSLTGEENFANRNTAYSSHQNSLANLNNTSFLMDQKIRNAEAALKTAKENLQSVERKDINEESISPNQIQKSKLSIELLEVSLDNLNKTKNQKEQNLLAAYLTSIDHSYSLISDLLSYIYSVNDKSFPDTKTRFELKNDFIAKDSNNEAALETAVTILRNNYLEYKDRYNKTRLETNIQKDEVLSLGNETTRVMGLAHDTAIKMNTLIADLLDHTDMRRDNIDLLRATFVTYSADINQMLLSQDNGVAIGLIGTKQSLDNLELDYTNNKNEILKQIELGETQYSLLSRTVNSTKDNLSSQVTIAQSLVAQAEEALSDAKRSKDVQVQIAKTQADVQKGSLNLANVQAANSFLKAPYNSVVMERLVEEGTVVNAGMPILKVADVSTYKLVIYIPEKDIQHIKVGQIASATLDFLPNEHIAATILRISPKTEEDTKKIRVELLIEPLDFLKIGMSLTVRFDLSTKIEILTVRKDSIKKIYGESFIFLVDDSSVEIRKIITGTTIDKQIEVLSGIEENNLYITKDIDDLRNGDNVEVIN